LRPGFFNFIVLPCLLALAAAVLLFSMSVPRTLRSIIPSIGFSPSTSMEPYDLDFKIDLDADTRTGSFPGRRLAEWRVRVPRAFVLRQVGENGKLGDGKNMKFSVGLYAMLDTATQQFVPASTIANKNPADGVFITLSNRLVHKKLIDAKRCLRADDADGFYGNPHRTELVCDPNRLYPPQCLVYAQYQGWAVRMQIPRKYYLGEYQNYCTKALDFIGKHTVQISKFPDLGF